MLDQSKPLYHDLDYIQGQIESVKALVLAVAQNMDKDFFREQALQRLETLRTVHVHSERPEADTRLLAVEHTEEWVKKITS
jgi:hypothetical protein